MKARKSIRKTLVCGMVLALLAVVFAVVPMNVSAEETIPEGMVSYWRFDEGSGTIAGDSVIGNDGSIGPAPSTGPTWITGKLGDALNFDGIDDHVHIPASASLDLGGPLAMELWFYLTEYPSDYDSLIWIETNSGGYHRGIWGHSSHNLYFQPGGSYGTAWVSDIEYSLNQWTHIATNIYQQGSDIVQDIYINGVLATSHTYSSASLWSNAGHCRIGDDSMGRYTDGMIDEVAIWNRALTSNEILQHYNNGNGIEITPDSSTIGLWHFDDGTGTTALDSSGNNNDGTLSPNLSGPTWTTGQVGSALDFDGVDDHVHIPDSGFTIAIELWFYPTEYPTDYDCLIWIETQSGGYHRGIWGAGNGRLYFQPGGSYGTAWVSDIEYSLNQWTYVATNIYQQGSNIIQEVYINGALTTTHTYPSATMWSNAGYYRIGGDNIGRNFKGMIDEVAVCNRAFTVEEIQQHYNNGNGIEITPDSSTMGLWRFDDGTGIIALDSSDNNNDGTLSPNVSGPTWTTGQVGSALNFDGVDDHVHIPASTSLSLISPIAIELWFYPTEYPNDYDCLIYIQTQSGGYHRGIWGASSGRLYFQPGGTYGTSWQSEIIYSLNQWTHIATNIYQEGSNIIQEIYINGALAATHTYPSATMWSNAGYCRIGADNNGRYFCGMIDEVAIWKEALSSYEILRHYNNGLVGQGYGEVIPEDVVEDVIDEIDDIIVPEGSEDDVNNAIDELENATQSFELGLIENGINDLGKAVEDLTKAQDDGADTQEVIEGITDFTSDLVDSAIDDFAAEPNADTDDIAKAQELFDSAQQSMEQGDYETALKDLEKAYKKASKA